MAVSRNLAVIVASTCLSTVRKMHIAATTGDAKVTIRRASSAAIRRLSGSDKMQASGPGPDLGCVVQAVMTLNRSPIGWPAGCSTRLLPEGT